MYYPKRIMMILCLISFIVLVLGGCESQNRQGNNSTAKDEIVLGFAMDTLVHERWLRDRDIFVARANELGAEVIVQTANSDSEEQEKQVEYLLDQGIDVLVLVPHDADKAADMVREAKSRGVSVISYDRLVKKANADLYISFDNIKVGEMMAGALVENVPEGNYLIINGSSSDNNSFMFNEGYKKVLDERIGSGSIKLVGETWIKNWLYEEAFKYVENTIGAGKKIDAIIAANDTLAGAAINALSEKRLADKVAVVGHDADLDACQRVVEGTQLATVYKPIDKIAKLAAEYAVRMAKGGLVQADDTISDGKYDIPFVKIPPTLVTSENMIDVIINDKFHKLEDVYMNIPKYEWPKIN